MAEERNLSIVETRGAAGETLGTTDEDVSKAELQKRMEEARESISQTVSEIKDTVTTQYQNVRESVSEALDWREQYRRRPVGFTIGAVSVGLLVGYSVAGVFKSDDENYVSHSFNEYGEDSEYATRSYAAQPIAGSAYGRGEDSRPSYSEGYKTPYKAETEEAEKPGLMERFKETKAYDRLQSEVSNIGNKVVEELSKTAQTVVIPLALAKLKELIGLDVSQKQHRSETAQNRPANTDAKDESARRSYDNEGKNFAQGASSR